MRFFHLIVGGYDLSEYHLSCFMRGSHQIIIVFLELYELGNWKRQHVLKFVKFVNPCFTGLSIYVKVQNSQYYKFITRNEENCD